MQLAAHATLPADVCNHVHVVPCGVPLYSLWYLEVVCYLVCGINQVHNVWYIMQLCDIRPVQLCGIIMHYSIMWCVIVSYHVQLYIMVSCEAVSCAAVWYHVLLCGHYVHMRVHLYGIHSVLKVLRNLMYSPKGAFRVPAILLIHIAVRALKTISIG